MDRNLHSARRTQRVRHFLAILLLAAGILLPRPAPAQSVLLIPKGMMFPFWRTVCMGATDAAREEGLELIYRGPRVENRIEAQLHIFNLYMEQKIDAVVVAPSHLSRLNTAIRRATDRGTKVVVIDSPVSTSAMNSFIATDNYAAGGLGAKLLLAKLPKKPRILLVGQVQGNASTDMREKGFCDYVTAKDPNAEVTVAHLEDGTFTCAMTAVNKELQQGRHFDGIFAVCEMSSIGALHALRYKPNYRIPFIAFDCTDELVNGLETGIIDAIIVQSPYSMGYVGVKTAARAIRGEPVEKHQVSPVVVLTRDNIKTEDSRLFRCSDADKEEYPMCFK